MNTRVRPMFVALPVLPVAAVAGWLLMPSPIEAVAWFPMKGPALDGVLAPNDELRQAEILGEGRFWLPEDITFNTEGRLYASTRERTDAPAGAADVNPRIERVTFGPDGQPSFETYVRLPGGGPLDLRFDRQGNLIVASWGKGLVSVAPDRSVRTLVREGDLIDGRRFGKPDGVAVASDGMIYFTQGTDAVHYSAVPEILSGRWVGRLLVHDPANKRARTLMDDVSFANGLALAPDESYILVSASTATASSVTG